MASGITNKVHVARNGAVLGSYDIGKIGDLLDNGQLQPSDHYFDTTRQEWVGLSELAEEEEPAQEFKQAEPRVEREGSSRRGGKGNGSRSRGKSKGGGKGAEGGGLVGWIACLFALGVAAGIWAWAANLNDQVKASDEKITSLNQQIETLKKENQMLNEITPPGRVRGVITYQPAPNQVAIMSGATVGLYKREDVEAALQAVSNQTGDAAIGDEAFNTAIDLLKSKISSPLEITLTDSNGRLDLQTPGPGEYVLVASAAKTSGSNTEKYFWLMGFRTGEQPSGLILMNEKNSISSSKGQLRITELPGFQTGGN